MLTEDERKVLGELWALNAHFKRAVYLRDVGNHLRISASLNYNIFKDLADKGFIAEEEGLCFYVTTAAGREALQNASKFEAQALAVADTAKTAHGESVTAETLRFDVAALEEQLAAVTAERDELRARVDTLEAKLRIHVASLGSLTRNGNWTMKDFEALMRETAKMIGLED